MKMIHSQKINKKFIFKSDGGIRFEDKVKYSAKELEILGSNNLDLDEIQAIHLLKEKFGGRVTKIKGKIKKDDNPMLSLSPRMMASVKKANEYHRNGYNMGMAIHLAAKEGVIDKAEVSREVGRFAAWVKGQKK